METGTVVEIRRFAVHDGPGIRTTVFLAGCPLDCAWCHNPESRIARPQPWWSAERCLACGACAQACPTGAVTLTERRVAIDLDRCDRTGACVAACPSGALTTHARTMTVAEVMAEVEADRAFYAASAGGLTLSGGEPLAQPAFALALLRAARAAGLDTAIETCLHAPWSALAPLVPLTGRFLADVKLADPEAHRRWTGHDNALILENLRRLHAAGAAITVRVPLIPGATDGEENLRAIAAAVRAIGPLPIELLDFNPLAEAKYRRLGRAWPFAGARPLGAARVAELQRIVA